MMSEATAAAYQRKDGRWAARYWHEGKRKITYGRTEEEAIQKRDEALNNLKLIMPAPNSFNNDIDTSVNNSYDFIGSDMNSGVYRANICEYEFNNHYKKDQVMSLGEWLTEWLNSYVKPNSDISTYKGYELYIYKHIIPSLGNIKLHDLSMNAFQGFFDEKAINGRLDGKCGGMSPKSIENMRFMINAAIGQAVECELINENCISNIETSKTVRRDVIYLSHEEEKRLITVCELLGGIPAYGIVLALQVGLQLGELLALKWDDIDLGNSKVYVNQTLSRCANTYEANGKSALRVSMSKTTRVIHGHDLPQDFSASLRNHRTNQVAEYGRVPEAVVSSTTGGHIDPSNYNKLFKRMLLKSGIDYANFDVLRNTFAMRYLEVGCDSEGLALALGCSGSSKTIKKYLQCYQQMQQLRIE